MDFLIEMKRQHSKKGTETSIYNVNGIHRIKDIESYMLYTCVLIVVGSFTIKNRLYF